MLVPRCRYEQQNDENNQALFRWRQNKNGKQSSHLPA
jgi:hypothetical protein